MNSRVPVVNTTTSPSPQPSAQTPINTVSPPSMLPLYPSVDIDAHVRPSSLHSAKWLLWNICRHHKWMHQIVHICFKQIIYLPLRLRAIMTQRWPWPARVAMKSLSQCSLHVGPTSSTGTRRVRGSFIWSMKLCRIVNLQRCWVSLCLHTGFTPLILAATAGHVGVVEILLDKGGDIEAQSERTKDTPLSLACSGGRQEVT